MIIVITASTMSMISKMVNEEMLRFFLLFLLVSADILTSLPFFTEIDYVAPRLP